MTITEKVAYLKGLMEGLKFDSDNPQGKVITKIVEILDDMALSVSDLEEQTDSLTDYTDELDQDLGDLEEFVYDDETSDDEDDDEDDDDSDYIEVECPKCGEKICFDDSIDPENVVCPNCGEHVNFYCDCGCGTDCGKEKDK